MTEPVTSAAVSSGVPAIDRYLADGFARVPGMSSRFAAAVCGGLLDIQTRLGVSGHIAEIGTFEGRFFIALAHTLQPGETALGMDLFDWPDAGVQGRFEANCRAHGLAGASWKAWKTDSRITAPATLREAIGGGQVRFFHVDGEHARASLERDLALATAVLDPAGVIVLDDMLHPGYPTLMVTVADYLARHPEMRVLAIIDRETIVAATKFVLCRRDWFERYEAALLARFRDRVWPLGADFEPDWCLVLSLDTRLAEIGGAKD